MILLLLNIAAAVAAVFPSAAPIASHAASASPAPVPEAATFALPSIESGAALPYPAYGSPQPQIVITRSAPGVPAFVTLDQATSIGVARVPSLAAARAEVDLEAAAVQLARTGLAPNVSIAGSGTGTYEQGGSAAAQETAGAGGRPSSFGQSNVATLSLSQLVYDGGQIRAKIDAASLTRDATLATYRRDAQEVAFDVATEFYQVLQDERAIAVDEELLRVDVVSENLVRAEVRAGTAAGADIATQVAVTALARATVVLAQGTLQTDRVAFAAALGLDADIDVLPQDDTQGLERATPALNLPIYLEALKIAYAERPDYEEAQLTVRSSRASLRQARLGLSPSVSFSGAKGLASSSPGGGSYRNDGTLELAISIPVYDQGVTRANVASSTASVAIATANSATTTLDVERDVRQALISIVSDRATLDQTRIAYASSVSALRSTQSQYRAGVTTIPALIQAEATLASSATNIVNSIYALRLAQSNLRYALGTILQ